jgi:hypothetical protein
MPVAPQDTHRIKDFDQLNDPAKLLDTVLEAESASGVDKNYKVTFPTIIQTVANNLPAPRKTTHIIARSYDTTDPNYIAGDETFLSIIASRPLVHMMTARVEFPHPTKEYRLVYDPNGAYQAYRDSTFAGGLNPCSWVEIGSAEDIASGVNHFNPFEAKYTKGNAVKYTIAGSLRIFEATQDLVKSTFSNNQQPAPTGLLTDPNWTEINAELAPNYSRLGQLVCRFYTNADRAADPYPFGDTVEELIARENAGASILYDKRLVYVSLGPQAGTYEVTYDPTNREFDAWVDGSFVGGRNPCSFKKVTTGAGSSTITLTGITENLGGFKFGDTFNGTNQEFAERLLIKYQYPGFTGFTFNGLGTQNVLAGTSYPAGNYRFDWSTSNAGNVAANRIDIEDATASLALTISTTNDGTETLPVGAFTVEQGHFQHFRIFGLDTQNNTFGAEVRLYGVLARMYGASSLTPNAMKSTLLASPAFVAGNYGLDEDLGTSLANNITANCSGGKYVYYLYDANLPDPTTVRAGLNAFSAYQVDRLDFNDSLGNLRKYKILYTTTIQFGAAVNVNVVN